MEDLDFEPKQLQVPLYLHRRLFRYMGVLTIERGEKVTVPAAIEHLLDNAEAAAARQESRQTQTRKA